MRFLVDESVGNIFAKLLKNAGHNVVFGGEAFPTVVDIEVLAFAEHEKRILITADKGFGKLIFRLKRPATGVILFRTVTTDPERRFEMIKDSLDKAEGKFIAVSEGRIRIREL